MTKQFLFGAFLLLAALTSAPAQYEGWQHAGSLWILTTPEGADLPATASEEGFPLLVRLNKATFDFSQTQPNGTDIRFSADGKPLAFEIEEWNAMQGTASIWVRIPTIKGNARQEIKLHWGKADAASASSGAAVFNESNGYVSVLHLSDPIKDEVGTLTPTNVSTTACAGMIGQGRHFDVGQGIKGGEGITNYPTGSSPHSTELWFKAEKPNATPLAWGNEQRQGKVLMDFESPPHIKMGCYFSGADVASRTKLPLAQWIHVMHTFKNGDSRIYVNGVLDGVSTSAAAPLAIQSPARMYVGGWYNNYRFVGDMDEVRISKVTRSADWAKLQYENQKPMQTLVGTLAQPGHEFSVAPAEIKLDEGASVTVTAQAGGAQKVYWIIKRGNTDSIAAVDQYAYTFDAGRVESETAFVLQFKALYANEVKTRNIHVEIREAIPEPVFTLRAPAQWNGRERIEVVPLISNLAAMQAKGAGELHYRWSVSGGAVLKEVVPGKLILTRSQYTGPLTVKLTLNNGGADYAATTAIQVTEPKSDPWVQRTPDKDEQPVDNQFYARDDQNGGTLFYNGTLEQPAEAVFLKVYADDKLVKTESQQPAADKTYAFTVKLKPGLIKYKMEFGTRTGGADTVLRSVTNLVCGDAFLIDGQSNALATDTREEAPPYTSDWIRSYGRPPAKSKDSPGGRTENLWCNAVWKGRGDKAVLGYWGMELAKRLVDSQKIPIFIVNGAVGGTRIDMHQRNPDDPEDLTTIYGRMLWRVRQAKLTHGIRGVLWHQGENDQGSAGPTGGYGWESYQQYFMDMSAAWKQDYPNLQHYYVFQIWPNSCSMGGREGSGDRLREVQRTLPRLYSNMDVMSTLGIKPPGGCHYPLTGWAEFARLMQPLIERDIYGKTPTTSLTPPNLKRAYYVNNAKDALALEFDQPVVWMDALANQFYLDGEKDQVISGAVAGNVLTLKLNAASAARKITYLKEIAWSQDNLLYGVNGIAALTFCDVGIAASPVAEPPRFVFKPTVASLKQYETPEWFEDAKLGIYMHWGPQSIPGVATTWYARWIYEQGSEGYKYHVATYGHPSKFGYKDICKLFKAEKFDQAQADRLAELYKRAGARYLVPVAVHHDNFDMWDSKYQPRFNSVAMSGKDVVGMWRKAADKSGLHLGVASHCARSYRWFQPSHGADHSGPLAGVPYDGQNPEYADLYGVKWNDTSFWYEQMSDVGPPAFEQNFENRMKDLMDKYHPDLYYVDGGIPFHQAGLNILAHFYNANQQWNDGKLQAVATIKLDWTPNVAINNYEFGYPETVQHYQWQSDKTMGADWYWIRNATARYMPLQQVMHMLVDTVSKNGNLLLNVPLTPAGELEPETVNLLTEMGRCLDLMGEAIFATRGWETAAEDGLRFTRNKDNTVLYAINLGWSNDELRIGTLGSSRADLKTLTGVSLLGAPGPLTYSQTADGLSIKMPPQPPYASPVYAFKLTFSGQIPVLKSNK